MLHFTTLAAAVLMLANGAAAPQPERASVARPAAGNWTTTAQWSANLPAPTGERLPADHRCAANRLVQASMTPAGKSVLARPGCSSGDIIMTGRKLP